MMIFDRFTLPKWTRRFSLSGWLAIALSIVVTLFLGQCAWHAWRDDQTTVARNRVEKGAAGASIEAGRSAVNKAEESGAEAAQTKEEVRDALDEINSLPPDRRDDAALRWMCERSGNRDASCQVP